MMPISLIPHFWYRSVDDRYCASASCIRRAVQQRDTGNDIGWLDEVPTG
jgi:hypothetical protein